MLPNLFRPKIPAIYELTGDMWRNHGAVEYVAHAITARSEAVLLHGLIAGSGSGARNHPDQKYWRDNQVAMVQGLLRIEVDCTLMPCDGQFDGCLYQVPRLVEQAGYPNTPLRIFSHRDEHMGGRLSSKRYFDCRSSDTNNALTGAAKNHGGWGWSEWKESYP